jgi:hypothetical protein
MAEARDIRAELLAEVAMWPAPMRELFLRRNDEAMARAREIGRLIAEDVMRGNTANPLLEVDDEAVQGLQVDDRAGRGPVADGC